jgi:hypothetical protein
MQQRPVSRRRWPVHISLPLPHFYYPINTHHAQLWGIPGTW